MHARRSAKAASSYPAGSGWSFTRYYLPHAYEAGLRLEKCAPLLWDAFADTHRDSGLAGKVEIPMEYFSRAVEAVLLDGLTRDAIDVDLSAQRWAEVVKHCGYVASEQAVESNVRGLRS